MKHTLSLMAGILLAAGMTIAATETNEVLRIDFEQSEGYTLGNAIGQKGWTQSDGNANTKVEVVNKDTFSTIVSGNQALFVGVQDTASTDGCGAYVDFDVSSIDPEKYYVQFEAQMKPSEVGSGAYAGEFHVLDTNNVRLTRTLIFNGGFWSSVYSMKNSAIAWAFSPDSTQGGPEQISGRPDFSQFTKVCYTFDLSKKVLFSIDFGDEHCYYTNRWDSETGDPYSINVNCPFGVNPSFAGPARLAVIGNNERPESGLDAFVIRTISKPESKNPGKLACSAKAVYLNYKGSNTVFAISNEGDLPYDYTVTSDSEWLKPVTASGTCSGSASIAINLDRSLMTETKYYRGIVTVDGGTAGSCQVRVSAQSDRVYFAEDFSGPYMPYGEIVANMDRWDGNMSPPTTYNIVTTNAYDREGIGYINQTCWYDGQLVSVDTRNDEILHVGCDIYIPNSSETTDLEFKAGYWAQAFNIHFNYTNSSIFVVKSINNNTLICDGLEWPKDTWTRVDAVLDFQAQVMTSLTIGDFVTNNIAIPLMLNTKSEEIHNLPDLSIYATPQENMSRIGLDNIIVEEKERTGSPELVAPSVVQLGSADKATLALRNSGVGAFNFTVSALENEKAFTFTPASGVVSNRTDVTMEVNRTGLEPGFYRTHVLISAGEAGSATTIVTFACGGFYYACNFEEPWFVPGSIKGQETWTFDPDQPASNFSDYVTNGVLKLDAAPGYTGIRADITAPTNKYMTVKTWIYADSETMPNGSRLYFKQNSAWPYAEFYVEYDEENTQLKLIKSGIEEAEFCMTAPMDQWIPFSYTLWFPDESISEVTFGENTEEPGALYLSHLDNAFTKIIMCASDNSGFLVDNISVYDPEMVPEPALLAMLALVGGLFLRRR